MSDSEKPSKLSREELVKLAKETAEAYAQRHLEKLFVALDSADVSGLLGVIKVFENAETRMREDIRYMN